MPDRSTDSSRTSMATPIGGLAHLFSDARPQDRRDRGFFLGGGIMGWVQMFVVEMKG